MTATYQVFKETAVPGTLVPNGIYMITDPNNADFVSVYVANSAGTATRHTPSQADIQALISSAQGNNNFITATIATRDALNPGNGDTAWVQDASADATVDSGSAQYIWNGSAWEKMGETESLDMSLNWADIVGGPSSTSAQIDAAVSNSHTHANLTQLTKVGEDGGGNFTYGGQEFVATGAVNW